MAFTTKHLFKNSLKQRSLLRRLVLGCVGLLSLIWLALFGLEFYSSYTNGEEVLETQFKTLSRQLLIVLEPLADQPELINQVVSKLEALEEDLMGGNKEEKRFRMQVWQHGKVLYSVADLPTEVPITPFEKVVPIAPGSAYYGYAIADPATGLTVRLSMENPAYYWINEQAAGFYFLPLMVSLPFMIWPIWLVLRRGLHPLNQIGERIATRSANDLSPLPVSSYKELAPIEHAVNLLMARLATRIVQEQSFLADAAHELKTPLAVIQVNAESLLTTSQPERQAEAALGLEQGVKRAAHTVHQLLNLMRTQSDSLTTQGFAAIDLVVLLRQRIADMVPIAQARLQELTLDSPVTCVILGNHLALCMLIDNLLDNAIKYAPSASLIETSLSVTDEGVLLSVTDQGAGIPASLRDQVFERFYRVAGQDQTGSGLGLAIVQKVAAQHGAKVVLDDNPAGSGLQVRVLFARPAVSSLSDAF